MLVPTPRLRPNHQAACWNAVLSPLRVLTQQVLVGTVRAFLTGSLLLLLLAAGSML